MTRKLSVPKFSPQHGGYICQRVRLRNSVEEIVSPLLWSACTPPSCDEIVGSGYMYAPRGEGVLSTAIGSFRGTKTFKKTFKGRAHARNICACPLTGWAERGYCRAWRACAWYNMVDYGRHARDMKHIRIRSNTCGQTVMR